MLIPTYTPLRTDEPSASESRVFFGGVNVFLQQHSALFRHTPWFLDSLLDSPKLLEWLSARSAGMDVAKLGALTVSTLAGRKGRQRKEIAKLLRWLARRRSSGRGSSVERDAGRNGSGTARGIAGADPVHAFGRRHFSGAT